jgi:hypothetical protein
MTVRVTPASSRSREARPGLSWSVRSLRQAPQWSAERRAGFEQIKWRRLRTLVCAARAEPPPVSSPRKRRRIGWWHGHGWMRLSALRFPLFCLFLRCCSSSWAKLGRVRAARTMLLIRPRAVKRSGGGGPSEGRWRGHAALELSVRPAPLPPSFTRFARFGWSPLPAVAGRDEAVANAPRG